MPERLDDFIRNAALPHDLPWGGKNPCLFSDATIAIADALGIPGCEVETRALELDIFPLRYLRNMQSVSRDEQIKLLRATVAMVGLGGLGGTVLELLARQGVGHIRGADGDSFEGTNLNRQLLSNMDRIGMNKCEAAAEHVAKINPSIVYSKHTEFLDEQDFAEFLEGCTLAIDALGGLKHRKMLMNAAAEVGVPLVSGALAGWTGFVSTIMPGKTGPADFFGTDDAAEVQLGCPAPSVSTIASLMATEATRILCGNAPTLAGKMLLIDLTTMSFENISL